MKLNVPGIMPLVLAYYAKPGNRAGGSLNIVLEDRYVKDRDVQLCIDEATMMGDFDAVKLGVLLLCMSQKQRIKISRQIDKIRNL